MRLIPICLSLAASVVVAPLAAQAQENSIMQSFHPEKFEKKDGAKREAKGAPAGAKGEGSTAAAPRGEAAPAQAEAK